MKERPDGFRIRRKPAPSGLRELDSLAVEADGHIFTCRWPRAGLKLAFNS
jgi:hypothetical protein